MRLDKYLGATGCCSRSEAKKNIRAGKVVVNGAVANSAELQVNAETDEIIFCGKTVSYRKYTYIMLNKPEGYVSATEDGRERTVLDLLPSDMKKDKLFPCGRLDKNTLGLMLITDNGELAHRLLAPKTHVSKEYRFSSKFPVSESDAKRFEGGVTLDDGYVTLPAKIVLDADGMGGVITLTEGKYHQIKRMLEALDNKITYLERISFGELVLDNSLKRGEWRYLIDGEIALLEAHAK